MTVTHNLRVSTKIGKGVLHHKLRPPESRSQSKLGLVENGWTKNNSSTFGHRTLVFTPSMLKLAARMPLTVIKSIGLTEMSSGQDTASLLLRRNGAIHFISLKILSLECCKIFVKHLRRPVPNVSILLEAWNSIFAQIWMQNRFIKVSR